MSDPIKELLVKFHKDRVLAHQSLFRARHPNVTPWFHKEMIRDWHNRRLKHLLWLVFRGGAKSTIAEEGILLGAAFREYRNFIIVGDTAQRAGERLGAIKYEVETNELLLQLFGDLKGETWTDDEIVLSNGTRLLSMGRGQSIRGIKFNDMRPDGWFCDDLENEESVRTPDAREKTRKWFMKELMPACDPNHHGRMAATPLDPESLPMILARPGSGFRLRTYPIEYRGTEKEGLRQPTWPDRFPLPEIDAIQARYASLGMMREYNMEYMVKAETVAEKSFKSDMFRIEPTLRTWQAVYTMTDPARTIGAKSATTGGCAWSWIGNRLVVWEGWAKKLLPDEIVQAQFDMHERYHPTLMGIEEDGLNEFLLQPLRHEQSRRHVMLPLKPMKAPKGKLDFIRALQPFFNAREVIFAADCPDLRSQLLAFPTGAIDAPNALAYALAMRPGAPMFDDFGQRHIAEDLRGIGGTPYWLASNATSQYTTGALLQFIDGTLRVLADWVREGDPSENLREILSHAGAEAGVQPRLTAPPQHWNQYTNVGLRQTASAVPIELRKGLEPQRGIDFIRQLLRREIKSRPALQVSDQARWTLNGFAGGYARSLSKTGQLMDFADEGPYRTLFEGIASFAGLLVIGSADEDDAPAIYRTTNSGVRYRSILPQRA